MPPPSHALADSARDKTMRDRLRLQPRLVPMPLWGQSARKYIGWTLRWWQIRWDVLSKAGNRCSVCGATGPSLECDEKWSYADRTGIATLSGFRMLCDPCHLAKQYARACAHGKKSDALDQLCRVNRISKRRAEELCARARATWKERSVRPWTIRVIPALLKRYPQLQVLDGIEKHPRRKETTVFS